jgi:hypothetical protein
MGSANRNTRGNMEPVDTFASVSGYVVSYNNEIEAEEGGPRPGSLVRVGDVEILRQFQLISMFGLRACFHADRAVVLTNCRPSAISSNEPYVPAQFVERIFDSQQRGTMDEVNQFVRLVDKIVRLPRARYAAVLSVLETLERGLEAVDGSLDLAYSMVVYCLEALCQNFDRYTPRWEDFEQTQRRRIDELLRDEASSRAAQFRAALLAGSHQKLMARFVDFVEGHVDESFFIEHGRGRSAPLRRSQLRRSLKNAYALRSGYVHQLQSIREQLHIPALAARDVIMWAGEPYLTLRGLMDLAFCVVTRFIHDAEGSDVEAFDWRSDLPGRLSIEKAPQHWIWKHDHIKSLAPKERLADVRSRYAGLLQLIVSVVKHGEGGLVPLRDVLMVYQEIAPQASKQERASLLATYALHNSLAGEHAVSEWRPWLRRYEAEMGAPVMEFIILRLLLNDFIVESFDAIVSEYEQHARERFSPSTLRIPAIVEVKLLCAIANMALSAGNNSEFLRFINLALGESSGDEEMQKVLQADRASLRPVDHHSIFALVARSKEPLAEVDAEPLASGKDVAPSSEEG